MDFKTGLDQPRKTLPSQSEPKVINVCTLSDHLPVSDSVI